MGKIREFFIRLDGDTNYYTVSGDGRLRVSGNIILVLNEGIQMKYLKLKFLGTSHCSWSEGSGDDKSTYSSTDQIFEVELELLQSGRPVVFNPGAYTFPFNFEAIGSRHLPSSFSDHANGKILYQLLAKMDRIGNVFDDKANLPIILWNPPRVDLRANMEPVEREEEHTDCCLCCASGPVIVYATFNRTAIRSGSDDTIDVSLSVTNMKNVSVTPKAYIEQTAMFRAGGRSVRGVKNVFEVEANPVMARTRDNHVTLRIGPILEPICGDLNSTTNITVSYRIVVGMKCSNVKIYQPITIALDMLAPPFGFAGQASR